MGRSWTDDIPFADEVIAKGSSWEPREVVMEKAGQDRAGYGYPGRVWTPAQLGSSRGWGGP